jgi:hypothetical protein
VSTSVKALEARVAELEKWRDEHTHACTRQAQRCNGDLDAIGQKLVPRVEELWLRVFRRIMPSVQTTLLPSQVERLREPGP